MNKRKITFLCLTLVIMLLIFISLNYTRKESVVNYPQFEGYLEEFSLALNIDLDKYVVLDFKDAIKYIENITDDSDELVSFLDTYIDAYHGANYTKIGPTITIIDKDHESILLLFKTNENKIIKITILKEDEWNDYEIKEYDNISVITYLKIS